MESEILIPLMTAIIGGALATVPSMVGYRMRKIELEHQYKISTSDRFYKLTMEYIDDIYRPMYKLLNNFESITMDDKLVGVDFSHSICAQLDGFKNILAKEERMFVTESIDSELVEMYWFIQNSLHAKKDTIAIKSVLETFGMRQIQYFTFNFSNRYSATLVLVLVEFLNMLNNVLDIIPFRFLHKKIAYAKFHLYYKSAILEDDNFRKQLYSYVVSLKSEIKEILHGYSN